MAPSVLIHEIDITFDETKMRYTLSKDRDSVTNRSTSSSQVEVENIGDTQRLSQGQNETAQSESDFEQ